MVATCLEPLGAIGVWLMGQEKVQSAIHKMSPEQRAKVLAAFAAFLILGFGLVALVWLGARVTRRYMNPRPLRPRSADMPDDWSSKPLSRIPAVPEQGDDPPAE